MHTPLNFTPIAHTGLKKKAALLLLTLAAASVIPTGCKRPTEKADEDVSVNVTAAQNALQTKLDAPAGLALAGKAVADRTASQPAQATANMVAGEAELLLADDALRQIDDAQIRLEHLLGRVNEMSLQIQLNNVISAGLTAKDPKATVAAIDKNTNAAKAGEQGIWLASDVAPIPALAAVDKTVADLTQVIDGLKTHHADLEKQRNDALQKAEQLGAQSEKTKAQQSVDLFTEASNSRKTAGNLSTQMSQADSDMAAAQRELAVAQAKQTQLNAALTKFADESKQVTGGWDEVQKRIDNVAAKSKVIVESDSSAAPTPATQPGDMLAINSISIAANQIDQLSLELSKLRDEAKAHLDKADEHYAAVAKLNHDLQGEYGKYLGSGDLKQSPSRPAWQWMVEIHNDNDPALQRAQVAQRLARLYADIVYLANARVITEKSLKTVLDEAKITVPKTLELGDLESKVAEARTAAEDAFKKTEGFLDDAGKGGGSDTVKAVQQSANVVKLIEQYGRWAFAKSNADPSADNYLRSAKDVLAQLIADNVPLPYPLPAEIAPVPAGGTTLAPMTVPATLPTDTTQPTTSATDATQPAAPGISPATTPSADSPPATPVPAATPAPATAPTPDSK